MELNTRQDTALEICSERITDSIESMPYYNREQAITSIRLAIKDFIPKLIQEHASAEEREYNSLLELQSRRKIGSKEYLETGLKISVLKKRIKQANILSNNIKKQDGLYLLSEAVKERFGEQVLKELLNR